MSLNASPSFAPSVSFHQKKSKMKYLNILVFLILIGCNSNTLRKNKDSKPVVKNGSLISVEGMDVSKYEIITEDVEPVESITLEHLICIANTGCQVELLKELISRNVNLNSKTCNDRPAITFIANCSSEANIKLAKLMIENGANINDVDASNKSLLYYAIHRNRIELVKYLIENKANKNIRDTYEKTGCLPIHRCKSLEMLKLLRSRGFELNVKCSNGKNLLHYAVNNNSTELANYLVANKLVEINHKDKNGETPLDYAKRINRLEIVKILE